MCTVSSIVLLLSIMGHDMVFVTFTTRQTWHLVCCHRQAVGSYQKLLQLYFCLSLLFFTSAILLTQVWKSPDISKSNAVAQEGHEELNRIFPLLPFLYLVCFWICGANSTNFLRIILTFVDLNKCWKILVWTIFRIFESHERLFPGILLWATISYTT